MSSSLKQLVEKVGLALQKARLMLATAESCTGGGLSYWITSIPNSSQWFERGFVTYSELAKVEMLGVNPETLARHGAVSEQTVCEMAIGALRHSHADISLAITGIAGPSGGSKQKPVGTVWLAIATKDTPPRPQVEIFKGDRTTIRLAAMQTILENLLNQLNL